MRNCWLIALSVDKGDAADYNHQEYREARARYGIGAIPTVIFDGGRTIVGTVSFDDYAGALRHLGVR